jgi:hypothetical protein
VSLGLLLILDFLVILKELVGFFCVLPVVACVMLDFLSLLLQRLDHLHSLLVNLLSLLVLDLFQSLQRLYHISLKIVAQLPRLLRLVVRIRLECLYELLKLSTGNLREGSLRNSMTLLA